MNEDSSAAAAAASSTTKARCCERGHAARLRDGSVFECSGCELQFDEESARIDCDCGHWCLGCLLANSVYRTGRRGGRSRRITNDGAMMDEESAAVLVANQADANKVGGNEVGALSSPPPDAESSVANTGNKDDELSYPPPAGLSCIPPFPFDTVTVCACPRCGQTPIATVFPACCVYCRRHVRSLAGFQCIKCMSNTATIASRRGGVNSATTTTTATATFIGGGKEESPSPSSLSVPPRVPDGVPFAVCARCAIHPSIQGSCELGTTEVNVVGGGRGGGAPITFTNMDTVGAMQRRNDEGGETARGGDATTALGHDQSNDPSNTAAVAQTLTSLARLPVAMATSDEDDPAALENIFAQQMLTLRQQLERLATDLTRQELAAPDCNPEASFRAVTVPSLRCPPVFATGKGTSGNSCGGGDGNQNKEEDEARGGDAVAAVETKGAASNDLPNGKDVTDDPKQQASHITGGFHPLQCSHYGRLSWTCDACATDYAARSVSLMCRPCRYDRCLDCLLKVDGIVPLCPNSTECRSTKRGKNKNDEDDGFAAESEDDDNHFPLISLANLASSSSTLPNSENTTASPATATAEKHHHAMRPNDCYGAHECMQCGVEFGLWQGYVCEVCTLARMAREARSMSRGGEAKTEEEKEITHAQDTATTNLPFSVPAICVSCAMLNHNEANECYEKEGNKGDSEASAEIITLASSNRNHQQPKCLIDHPLLAAPHKGKKTEEVHKVNNALNKSFIRCCLFVADDCAICQCPCDEEEEEATVDHDSSSANRTPRQQPLPLPSGEVIRVSCPGGHVFHKACIAVWLRTQHVCPVCRVDISGRKREQRQTAD